MRRVSLGVSLCLALLFASVVNAAEPAAAVADLAQTLQAGDAQAKIKAADALGDLGAGAKGAVNYLIAALGNEEAAVRWHAARALGSIGSDAAPAVAKLTDLLTSDKNGAARAYAAFALGRIGEASKPVVPQLAQALRDPDAVVRRQAILAIRTIKPPPEQMIPLVVSVLESASPHELLPALHSLAEGGARVVPRLIEALKHPRARYWACLVLSEIGPDAKDAVPALVGLLSDTDPEVRREAIMALGAIGEGARPAIGDLAKALDDQDNAVASSAAFTLGKLGPVAKPAIGALEKVRTQPNSLSPVISNWALAKIEPENQDRRQTAVAELTQALASKEPRVRVAALHGLADLKANGPEVIAQVARLLKDADAEARATAADALASFGEPALPALMTALGDPELRGYALAGIGRIGAKAKQAVPLIASAIGDSSPDLRREALFVLAAVGPDAAPATPIVVKVLENDPSPEVRHAAVFALGQIGPAARMAGPALHKTLQSSELPLASVSAWALAKIGDEDDATAKKSLPLLTAALKHPNEAVRAHAAEAIGLLGRRGASALVDLQAAADDSSELVRQSVQQAIAKINP
jgi:HEAT repeat protein